MALEWFKSDSNIQVSEEDILATEEKLKVKFPRAYRNMLRLHSGEFSEQLEEMISVDQLFSMNQLGDYYCLSFMDEHCLMKVIPIFSSLSGDYYALDYNVLNDKGEPTIIDVCHEQEEGGAEDLTRYDSFTDFLHNF